MWLKIDDNLIDHPKFFTAGRCLGKRGRMRAFTVYMAGLSWSNRHLSDGFIPHEAVRTFAIDEDPAQVARVLTLKTVGLWHKSKDGFRIHDYHDHNPTAAEMKEKRQQDRDRKRQERGGLKRGNPALSYAESVNCPAGQTVDCPSGLRPDSRALARARPDPDPDPDPHREKSTAAGATGFPRRVELGRPTHAHLCRLLKDLRRAEPHATDADLKEGLKVRCAELHLDYNHHPDAVERAMNASEVAWGKRRTA